MRKFESIIQSEEEPMANNLWLKDGILYCFEAGNWRPLNSKEGNNESLYDIGKIDIINPDRTIVITDPMEINRFKYCTDLICTLYDKYEYNYIGSKRITNEIMSLTERRYYTIYVQSQYKESTAPIGITATISDTEVRVFISKLLPQ